LRGIFFVGASPKATSPKTSRPGGFPLIQALLRLAALPAMARAAKASAADTAQRAALVAAAGLAGLVGLFCFTNASLTLLERHMDSAEAWSLVGGFYAVVGGLLYFASTRRRRG
jgi:hypothetical protein